MLGKFYELSHIVLITIPTTQDVFKKLSNNTQVHFNKSINNLIIPLTKLKHTVSKINTFRRLKKKNTYFEFLGLSFQIHN